jgi:hypothetical protein
MVLDMAEIQIMQISQVSVNNFTYIVYLLSYHLKFIYIKSYMFDNFSNQSRPFIILYHHFVLLLSPLISWIPKYVPRVIRREPLVEQELLNLPGHPRSPSVLSGVRVARYLYLVFFILLFVLSSFTSLYCLNVFFSAPPF